jgi:hypothetical protein
MPSARAEKILLCFQVAAEAFPVSGLGRQRRDMEKLVWLL